MVWCRGAGAVVLAVAVAVVVAVAGRGDEDEGDTAEFVVAVEGGPEGARCAGALVALRAALTSARCARSADLWVRAPHARLGVQVLRVAVADLHAPAAAEAVAGAEGQWVWGGVGADLALLELAEVVRGARPILAAAGGECAPRAPCYVPRVRARLVRVVGASLEPPARCVARGARWPAPLHERALCLVGARLCRGDWGAAVVCGGKLCGVLARSAQGDGGDGGDGPDAEDTTAAAARNDNETQCGDTHAAVSVPRAHRFMRCAMLPGACGRGECERVCAERRLHDEPPTTRDSSPGSTRGAPLAFHTSGHDQDLLLVSAGSERSIATTTRKTDVESPELESPVTVDESVSAVTHAGGTAGADASQYAGVNESAGASEVTGADASATASEDSGTVASADTRVDTSTSTDTDTDADADKDAGASTTTGVPGVSPCAATRTGSFEFEPNRADFKMTPARTTAVCLKAGEYGDNAAEYGAGDDAGAGACVTGPALSLSPSPRPPTRSSPAPAPAPAPVVRHAELEARVSPAPAPAMPRARTGRAPPSRRVLLSPLLAATCCLFSFH